MFTSRLHHALALVPLALACGCQMPTDQQVADLTALAAAAISSSNAQATPARSAPAPSAPMTGQPAPVAASPQQPAGQCDGRLVGTWQRSESFGGSGGYSGALRETLTISGNGTFVLGPGEFAGGGGGVSGGESTTGRWATSNSVVYVSDGSSGFEAYARYYVEGNKLMFTFGDGSHQVWYRA